MNKLRRFAGICAFLVAVITWALVGNANAAVEPGDGSVNTGGVTNRHCEIHISVDNRLTTNLSQDAPHNIFDVKVLDSEGNMVELVRADGILQGRLEDFGWEGADTIVITSPAPKEWVVDSTYFRTQSSAEVYFQQNEEGFWEFVVPLCRDSEYTHAFIGFGFTKTE